MLLTEALIDWVRKFQASRPERRYTGYGVPGMVKRMNLEKTTVYTTMYTRGLSSDQATPMIEPR